MAKDAINKVRTGVFEPKQGTAIGSLLSVALQGMKRLDEEKDEAGERPFEGESADRLKEALRALEQAPKH